MTLSVFDAASEAPDRAALVLGDRVVTFSDLGEQVRAKVSSLAREGLPTGNRYPTWMVGSSDFDSLVQLYSFIEVGQPVALVHPKLKEAERRPIIDLFDARANARSTSDEVKLVPLDDELCLAIVFTSGTTGTPKGIVLSRRAFLASARASAENIGWQDDDRWLLGLPLAHVGGLSVVTRCLVARRTVVVPSEVAAGRRLDAAGIARAIEAERVTLVSLVPTQLEWLTSLDPPWQPPAHLRAILLGGAPARASLLERAADLRLPILTTYGLTEACSQVTTQPRGTANRGDMGAGSPLAGTEVRLAEDGAIEIRGETLLSGYFPDSGTPLRQDGWFRTDDIGRFDERGMLHIVGRRSELIVTGGENVYPREVESVLEACPAVAGACVFGVPDDTWGEVVAAVVVPEGAPDLEAIAAFVQAHLAVHRRPRLIAFADALAASENGKLDRRATAALARGRLQPVKSRVGRDT
jgi:O-succinylbenzoic acid--CoA ligase